MKIKNKEEKVIKLRKFWSVIELLVLGFIILAIPLYVYFFKQDLLTEYNSFKDVVALLEAHKTKSVLIYIGLQILQIVISVIPGQVFQFAAGYLYGFFLGLLYSMIGATLGTIISYFMARLLGKNAVHVLFGEERMEKYVAKLNSRGAFNIVFLIYLIPGLPKDMVSYAAGISDMKLKTFLPVSLIGRFPGMAGSLLIGSLYYRGNYTAMTIIIVISVIAFILCLIKRKAIMTYIDKFYEKLK